jgi:hypothetical protein
MKIIALLPVKNEAWVLPHTFACLSSFCDVILVHDQQSSDGSREVAAHFPKVVWIESSDSKICEQARWHLWDIARQYDGENLVWCTDADELVSPARIRAFLDRRGAELTSGVVVDVMYCHFWNDPTRYRAGLGRYSPYRKPVAIVDNRRCDYDRARSLPLHEERVPIGTDTIRLQADDVPVLHLQWLLPNRSQMRQAWYRCRELLHGELEVPSINAQYAGTLPEWHVPTETIPGYWLEGVTLPDPSIDAEPTWQQADILNWFDECGIEFFEPLEIWHVPLLRDEFRRRTGRNPRCDRSHHPPLSRRARTFSLRAWNFVKRQLAS